MLVVALGPRREVASLGATDVASGGCRGNTAGARGAGLMLRRHRTQAGRTRASNPAPGGPASLTRSEPRSTGCPLRTADAAGLRIVSREGKRAGSQAACATSPSPNNTPRGSVRGGTSAWGKVLSTS